MSRTMICVALVAAFTLSACDKFGGGDKPAGKTAEVAKKAAPKKNVNQPVEDAMMQIPPQMRETYQAAFVCEVKRNKAKEDAKAIAVTPEYVRGLVQRLKDDPSIAKC